MKDNPVVYVVYSESYYSDDTQTTIRKVFIQESEAKKYVKNMKDVWEFIDYEKHQTQ